MHEQTLTGKRIGVVTPFDSNNYGAYLQAFSTKTLLESRGAEVAFLRFRGDEQRKRLFWGGRPGKRHLKNPPLYFSERDFGKRKYEVFSDAWGRFPAEEMGVFAKRDAFVLGSDEIWNVRHSVFRNNPVFFGYGLSRAISYAPSIGAASAEEIMGCPECCEGLAGLARVLVRDEASASAVEGLLGMRPDIVLDPTLLLDWGELALPASASKNPYLLVYAYGDSDLPVRQIREFAKGKGLRLISIGFKLSCCDEALIPDPLEFFSLMRGAEYVVTTTFHGSIFAMLSHSRFLTFPTSQKTEHLLKTFGMGGRRPSEGSFEGADDFGAALETVVDYEAFEGRRADLRERSLDLLFDGLSTVLTGGRH